MPGHRSRFVARLRRGLALRRREAALAAAPREPARAPAPGLRGLGEPSASGSRDEAGEAELDTLRGELVRELDRLAEGDDGSAAFRRIAS